MTFVRFGETRAMFLIKVFRQLSSDANLGLVHRLINGQETVKLKWNKIQFDKQVYRTMYKYIVKDWNSNIT